MHMMTEKVMVQKTGHMMNAYIIVIIKEDTYHNTVDDWVLNSEGWVRINQVQGESEIEEHFRKLAVGKGQSPESEVGGSV